MSKSVTFLVDSHVCKKNSGQDAERRKVGKRSTERGEVVKKARLTGRYELEKRAHEDGAAEANP